MARLYSDKAFLAQLQQRFAGKYTLRFNLAPPIISKRDPHTGHLLKREFGAWMMPAFRALARLRFLRGTALDIFGRSAERKQERADIQDYLRLLDDLCPKLDSSNYSTVLELAQLPASLRGFGHVKDHNREQLRVRQSALMQRLLDDAGTKAVKIVNAA